MEAHNEASEIAKLMPETYFRGVYYPVAYKGNEIKIALKSSPKGLYLHVLKPCATILKDTSGNELSRYADKRHFYIKMGDKNANWKEA